MELKTEYPSQLKAEYPQETILLGNVIQRYDLLQENQIMQAYQLSKDSLQLYNRFCFIKHQVKKNSTRGQDVAMKDWLKEICDYLDKISTHSRMIWKYAKEDRKKNEDL
ncbi:hypothetical protein CLSAB_18850 [Clostridium saccharobutylicum]|uniref:hypothetical protein n=1 Tax=Clostridium saccharobutylicum TaxID=169679 RepID=UPI00098C441E|nr:hypothetical protein [Clostridium saccharobutylicum]OOM17165.1 hypothetical protein CLSAB_18850 [Clostridium saccharobutylicum]